MSGIQIPVYEIFESVEGEGPDVGTPTIFLRMAGCDFKCPFCDTAKSWDVKKAHMKPIASVVKKIKKRLDDLQGIKRISVTGGNPAMSHKLLIALFYELMGTFGTRVGYNLEHPGIKMDDAPVRAPGYWSANLAKETDLLTHLATMAHMKEVRFSISMDAKLPLWPMRKRELANAVKAHVVLVSALLPLLSTETGRVTASVKALVATQADLLKLDHLQRESHECSSKGLSWWVGMVRDLNNKVDGGLTYHTMMAIARNIYPNGWRINPNLHVQLNLP